MWGDGFLQISVALVAALSWGPGVKPGGKVSEKGEASAFRRHLCCPYSVWNGPFCFISKEDQENRKVNVDNVGNPYWNCDISLFVLLEKTASKAPYAERPQGVCRSQHSPWEQLGDRQRVLGTTMGYQICYKNWAGTWQDFCGPIFEKTDDWEYYLYHLVSNPHHSPLISINLH